MSKPGPLNKCVDACVARKGQFFTMKTIMKETGLNRSQVRASLQKLEREDHLVLYRATRARATLKKGRPIIEDKVFLALPTLRERKAGREDFKQENTAWDGMWRALRVLKRFTKKDLVTTSGAESNNVSYFVKMLCRGGYLAKVGTQGREAVYVLTEDPGPNRPSWGAIKKAIEKKNAI
jgi:Fic family protein